jgi:hypothetical protein
MSDQSTDIHTLLPALPGNDDETFSPQGPVELPDDEPDYQWAEYNLPTELRPPLPTGGRHPISGVDTMRSIFLLSAFCLFAPQLAAAGDFDDLRHVPGTLLNAHGKS